MTQLEVIGFIIFHALETAVLFYIAFEISHTNYLIRKRNGERK